MRLEDSVKGELVVVKDIPEISFAVSDLNIKFENLFGGKAPALAEMVDWFINQNTEAFIKEFQSVIRSSVVELVKDLNNLTID